MVDEERCGSLGVWGFGMGLVSGVVGRGVLETVGRWRWRLGLRRRGIEVGRWIDEEREKGCVSSRNTWFISVRERLMNVLGRKKGKIGYSL